MCGIGNLDPAAASRLASALGGRGLDHHLAAVYVYKTALAEPAAGRQRNTESKLHRALPLRFLYEPCERKLDPQSS